MTQHRSTGFTIRISKPVAVSSDVLELDISQVTTSYSHSLSAFGGFDTCTFNINYNLTEAEKWMDRLFCHVEVFSPSLRKVWEGFINKITLASGGLSVVRGPFTDIGNRVSVVYSTVDTTVSPPIVGMRAVTAAADDTESQALYGVIEKRVSVGGATDDDAEQIRDTWIADNSLPATSQTFNSSGKASSSITVECLGYFHYLKLLVYDDTTSGLREISAIISDIFNYETGVNSIFSTDLTGIETPASPVSIARYTNDGNSALNRVKYCTSVGDANDSRWLFGIYADRKPYYWQAPTDVEYFQRITSRRQDVESAAQTPVMAYDVLPGKWLRYVDFLVGRPGGTSMRFDPRFEFVERVTFTAPNTIVHSGDKQSTLKQKLAKYGLAGASA
jgi:hypothetical protein